jgi:hypothetical protein
MMTATSPRASLASSDWENLSLSSSSDAATAAAMAAFNKLGSLSPLSLQSEKTLPPLPPPSSSRVLSREEMAKRAIEHFLGKPLPSNLRDSLKSGVRLLQFLKSLFPRQTADVRWSNHPSPDSHRKNLKLFLDRAAMCDKQVPLFRLNDFESGGEEGLARVSDTILHLARRRLGLLLALQAGAPATTIARAASSPPPRASRHLPQSPESSDAWELVGRDDEM